MHDLSDGQHAVREAMESGDLLELPHKFEHQEYSIVEQFCRTIKDPEQRDALFAAIRGKRAFRDFSAAVKRLGLEQRWHGFRNHAFEEIAAAFLEKNGIAFKRAA